MADADLEQFLEKIRQLNAFVALSEKLPELREALRQCGDHHAVVALARSHGFEIGRRWGERGDPPAVADDAPSGPGAIPLLGGEPPQPGEESVQVILATEGIRLERIHSCAASSPPGFWYDQPEEEWVCLLQGSASLQFEDEDQPTILGPGESLLIRAHRRHRLVATDSGPGTIWLALFWTHSPAG